MVGASWKDMWNRGVSPHGSNILRMVQGTQEAVVTAFKWLVGPPEPRGCGLPGTGLCRWVVSETDDKNRHKLDRGKGTPLYHLSPKIAQKGRCLNPRDTEGRDCKGSPIRVCGLNKECLVLDASEGNWDDVSWPVTVLSVVMG
jgi:hypothetical protein